MKRKRIVNVEVGRPGEKGKRWHTLKMTFKIERDDSGKPDKGSVQIYNLNSDSIKYIQKPGNQVFLYAGYENNETLPLMYSGDIREAKETISGVSNIMTITGKDGGNFYTKSKFSKTMKGPVNKLEVVKSLAASAGLTLKSLPALIKGDTTQFMNGFSSNGPSREALDNATKAMGCSWTIQNSELIVTKAGKPTDDRAVVLNSTSGLVGSPEITKTGIKFKALLDPWLMPRRIVKMESRLVTGFFLIRKATITGDSGYENSYFCECIAEEY